MGIFAVDQASGSIATVWMGDADGAMLRVIDGATGRSAGSSTVAPMAGSPVIARRDRGHRRRERSDDERRARVRAGGRDAAVEDPRRGAVPAGSRPARRRRRPLRRGPDRRRDRLALADGEATRWATAHQGALGVRPADPGRRRHPDLRTRTARSSPWTGSTGEIRARRRPAGLPVGLIAGPVGRGRRPAARATSDAIQAFAARSAGRSGPERRMTSRLQFPGNPSIPLGNSHARHPKVASEARPEVRLGRKVNNPRKGNSAWPSSP